MFGRRTIAKLREDLRQCDIARQSWQDGCERAWQEARERQQRDLYKVSAPAPQPAVPPRLEPFYWEVEEYAKAKGVSHAKAARVLTIDLLREAVSCTFCKETGAVLLALLDIL